MLGAALGALLATCLHIRHLLADRKTNIFEGHVSRFASCSACG